jgi:ABC-2 type transport system permease protein
MNAATSSIPAKRRAGMNLWRLEWLRLIRTPRAISLLAVFVLLGLAGPVLTKYEGSLVNGHTNGARIYIPPPTPADGLGSYISNESLIGLIVVITLAAAALTIDARPGLAVFLRTKATGMWRVVAPRFAVGAAAAVVAYALGSLAAWYETDVLIGPLPWLEMLVGILCGALYLVFAVAVTALAASLARGTSGTVAISLGTLLALPIIGTVHAVDAWLPSALVNAPVDLVSGAHPLSYFLPTLAVTTGATLAMLACAVLRLRTREL